MGFQNLDIPGPTRKVYPSRFDEEDYDQFGSAEHSIDYEIGKTVNRKGRPGKIQEVDNEDVISPPSARGTHVSFAETNDIAVAPPFGPKSPVSNIAITINISTILICITPLILFYFFI